MSKIILIAAVLTGTTLGAMADRGIGKKSKKVVLNISMPSSLRNSVNANFNTGLKYTGSLLNSQRSVGSTFFTTTLITYQKGNTVYIVPSKQKISAVPDLQKGYAGMKLVIRPH